ncbi:50S ribosomal protein L18e [Metallosphaera tengchongensis]|uniref:Large ribosomal subunit protein eL18 n=1 Tax=Metallosphaera tengchongensis TaxID=1532350 RepID=A0A6N0NXB3_9CREN|nr:50S ribosomal protein L18e [Metallosphaera tengchongensis]QKQ99730.1 50S ribosomal protein L18e [Metallosphaera tengchongensis]
MKRTGSTNVEVRKLIRALHKQGRPIWRAVAEELEAPSRKRSYINLYKINKYTKEGDFVVVPGKVLGIGNINHKVTVVALDFSQSALKKILNSGGKALSLVEGLKELEGKKNVRLMKG